MIPFRPVFAAFALAFSPFAAAQHAHEHGVADLRVAVDGDTVLVEFDSPLANLVGFEHAPRDAAEQVAIDALAVRLERPMTLFALTSEASCELVATELEIAGFEPGERDHHDDHGHGHEHKHKHDHGHDHGHADDHADAWVAWEFRCARVAALDGVDIGLIEAFPAIRSLRVEVAGPRGQSSQRIAAARERVAL